jgi:DNA polymerase III subunit epsilon
LDGHRIVEIGAVELINRSPTGRRFTATCARRATCRLTQSLTAEFPADEPLFAGIADEFLAFVRDAPLVVHRL